MSKKLRYSACINCEQQFSQSNTHSVAGWLETQISGLCENCFDEIYEEAIEEAGYDHDAAAF